MSTNLQRRSKLSAGLATSKPSKKSLVARGLAANEEKAQQRIEGKNIVQKSEKEKPRYIFYASSDSDADPVYSMNKKLDRCTSLLKNIINENETAAKKKAPALKPKATQQNKFGKKKVVKIVLPNATERPKQSKEGRKKDNAPVKTKMVTSTPRLAVKKTNNPRKKKEDELKKEIAQIEMEKSLLQDQYSHLLKQHLLTPDNHSNSMAIERKEAFQKIRHQTELSQFSKSATPKLNISNDVASSLVFKELEKTISGISQKLSFPSISEVSGTLTMNDRDEFAQEDDKFLQDDLDSEKFRNKTLDNGGPAKRESVDGNHVDVFQDLNMVETLQAMPTVRMNALDVASTRETPPKSTFIQNGISNSYVSTFNVNSNFSFSLSEEDEDDTLIEQSNEKEDNVVDDLHQSGLKVYAMNYDDNVDDESMNCINDEDTESEDSDERDTSQINGITKNVRFEKDERIVDILGDKEDENVDAAGSDDSEFENESVSNQEKDGGRRSMACQSNKQTGEDAEKSHRNENVQKKKESKQRRIQFPNEEQKKAEKSSFGSNEIEKGKESTVGEIAKDVNQSPNRVEKKPIMQVVSQLAMMKDAGDLPSKKRSARVDLHGIKPGYAASQITALSYLLKELMGLLSDRISSEESRLLNEIDHMIGLLPFLIDNLNPDLQTEINLAVQPLRVENSDLRRQLRIANQKIRDFEINVQELKVSLTTAKKYSLNEFQREKLKMQMQQEEAERKILVEKTADLNKNVEELRKENAKLVERISEKDAEIVRQKQLWQKERTSIYTENGTARNKLESLSLSLQAQEKENRILKLSLSQSEAEIIRLKDLNRDLRDSVAKLLRDVNFQDSRSRDKRTKHGIAPSQLQGCPIASVHIAFEDKKKQHLRGRRDPEAFHGGTPLGDAQKASNRIRNQESGDGERLRAFEPFHRDDNQAYRTLTHFSSSQEQESDISSCSTFSDYMKTISSCSKDDSYDEVGHVYNFSDQYSSLTCDSGEFRTNLANLSSNIKQMQQSLCNAKTT